MSYPIGVQNSDAHRRLLDMLAGWTEYVHKLADADAELPNGPTRAQCAKEADEISGLYQKAGAMTNTSEEWVNMFIISHVLGVLCRGTTKRPPDPSSH